MTAGARIPRVASGLLAGCALLAANGCNVVGAAAYYLSPPKIQKAEFTFPPGSRVTVLVDSANPEQLNFIFARNLHEKLNEYFRNRKTEATLIPHDTIVRMRVDHPDFSRWPVQKVGRECGATHVLYLRILDLQGREEPDHPVVSPAVRLQLRVIGVELPPGKARLWPAEEEDGREITCRRQSVEATTSDVEDRELGKLGVDTAWFVMMPFFDVDLEERRPVER